MIDALPNERHGPLKRILEMGKCKRMLNFFENLYTDSISLNHGDCALVLMGFCIIGS